MRCWEIGASWTEYAQKVRFYKLMLNVLMFSVVYTNTSKVKTTCASCVHWDLCAFLIGTKKQEYYIYCWTFCFILLSVTFCCWFFSIFNFAHTLTLYGNIVNSSSILSTELLNSLVSRLRIPMGTQKNTCSLNWY